MRILIATSRFKDYAGSEITVLEYAEQLKLQGNEVTIATFELFDTYSNYCKSLEIPLKEISDTSLSEVEWDIVWVFHTPTYYALFAKYCYKAKAVIFSSLSHFEPLESPPIELNKIGVFTTNSKENYDYFKINYPDYAERAVILPNSIPDVYFSAAPTKKNALYAKVLIVSNHLQPELLKLAELLREKDSLVNIYGVGFNESLITPEILNQYDSCITIGKTVQYCLALGIPVFCYDHFGGPGWITSKNVELASDFNFSGRCTNTKMTADEILQMFQASNVPNEEELVFLKNYSEIHFSLSRNLFSVIEKVLSCHDIIESIQKSTTNNILNKSVDVFTRQQKFLEEYKLSWSIETSKREELEERLMEIYNCWQAEIKTTSKLVLELNEVSGEVSSKEHSDFILKERENGKTLFLDIFRSVKAFIAYYIKTPNTK